MYSVIFWKFLFLFHFVDAVQRFVELPTYTEVNPGEDGLLHCRVSDKKGVCSWQKDNKPVGIYQGKYEWANEDSPTSGDCSLWVRAATLQLDDGQWLCQVTASNYDVPDALSSPPAAFAVRVPPQTPRILFNGSNVLPGQNITVPAGGRATVVCEARYGNPPAYIEWYLEKEKLTAWSQTNSSEVERPRVWAARSVLELGATRAARGKRLACRARHPSYPSPSYRETHAMLDVTFVPEVSIGGVDTSSLHSLEEGASVLTLECRASGNPSPYVWWTRDGQVIATNGAKLIRAPVNRNDSAIYGCQARNPLGTSDSVKIEVDVKYAPRVTWVGPDTVVDANLFSEVTLECKAEGNPPPSYQWYHNPNLSSESGHLADGYPISSTPQLLLHNVSYAQNGRYTCIATNHIGLEERSHQSEAVTLNVLGPPVGPDTSTAHAWSGSEGRVEASVCADPPPRRAAWLWGSLRLDVPSHIGRYEALEPHGADGCYRYALVIGGAALSDARAYVLHVENERGFSSHRVALTVHENFSLTETAHVAPLIAAALLAAALLVLVLCLAVRCRRRRESVEYKTDDLDSEKTVLPADATYSPAAAPRAGAGAGAGAGARYSPGALQAAMSSSEKEAKENVYTVHDPHIQYELTINKHGEPPKYLSLSKPLTHQRTHAFDPQHFKFNEINNNFYNENNFPVFKNDQKTRKSDRSNRRNNKNEQCYSRKSNHDVQYSINPQFGMFRQSDINYTSDAQNISNHPQGSFYHKGRIYEKNCSGRKNVTKVPQKKNADFNRIGDKRDLSRNKDIEKVEERRNGTGKENEQEHSFEELEEEHKLQDNMTNSMPRPGKVREIASRFNRNSCENIRQAAKEKIERPKPIQSYDQAYLDHVFPDAVEI